MMGFRVLGLGLGLGDSQVVSLLSTLLPHLFLVLCGVATTVSHAIPGIIAEFLTVKG